ncbi:HAD-IC family P-type ATPase, partial [Patescibacteria group bacterium]|nr:HAD-IC family P-type ATPase [Patescibacteria group bacterium]
MATQRKKQKPAHSLEWEKVIERFHSNAKAGLTGEQVKENLQRFGKNILPKESPPSNLRIFARQFKSPLIFILVIAGIVTFILDERTDSIVIFSAVLLNTIIGYIQENKATRSLDALKKILQKKAIVIREGIEREIGQEEVVPGDIIVLESGNSIPADARIIENWELHVQEAQLTGEWLASSKHTKVLDADTALADRDNMVYMGSTVSHGAGKAVVVASAKHTELGKIANLLKEVKEEKTPYQRKLGHFSWIIGAIVGVLVLFIYFQGIFVGRPGVEMFTIAVAIAVAAIPEGLPVAMTAVLAVGMRRILAKKGLVRRLASAETLGSTSVIATDKTLTLTEGKMEVEEIFTLKETSREEALRVAALANEAFIENPGAVFEKLSIKGRPTDKALLRAAMEAGVSKITLEKEMPLILRVPFDSEQKYIASFHKKSKQAKGIRVYVSGAPETILALSHCTREELHTAKGALTDLTSKGLRVVGLASKDVSKAEKEQIQNLHFIGFIALKDPLRREVKPAIA